MRERGLKNINVFYSTFTNVFYYFCHVFNVFFWNVFYIYASCRPTNSVSALKVKYHIPQTCSPEARLSRLQFSNFVSDH